MTTICNASAEEYPAERRTLTDPQTGATVIQWTSGASNNQHLYFTTFSVTADDRWLVFMSDRDGNPNLYSADRLSGSIRRISNNRSGLLFSYVYPEGGARGFCKTSPVLDVYHNVVYFIRDNTIYECHLDDKHPQERAIWQLPSGWVTAYAHISPDGQTLCLPCTDGKAFADTAATQWDQLRQVPARMMAQKLVSRIYLVDLRSGSARIAAELPFWVTHVQFDPAGTGRIVLNQEGFLPGTGQQIPDRIWCLEPDGRWRTLAPEMPGEWRSHENWSPDGAAILYHGGRQERRFIAARQWDGQLLYELNMPELACYHATFSHDGRALMIDCRDGTLSRVSLDHDMRRTILGRHDTSMKNQDTHAHPLVTPRGTSLIFTSDRSGACQVYELLLAD